MPKFEKFLSHISHDVVTSMIVLNLKLVALKTELAGLQTLFSDVHRLLSGS